MQRKDEDKVRKDEDKNNITIQPPISNNGEFP
jgi:hypothetical protein